MYYRKYLKYKSKYLKLNNIYHGGSSYQVPPSLKDDNDLLEYEFDIDENELDTDNARQDTLQKDLTELLKEELPKQPEHPVYKWTDADVPRHKLKTKQQLKEIKLKKTCREICNCYKKK